MKNFPKDITEQYAKATEIARGLIQKTLGRNEEFIVSFRRIAQDHHQEGPSHETMPPIEVQII